MATQMLPISLSNALNPSILWTLVTSFLISSFQLFLPIFIYFIIVFIRYYLTVLFCKVICRSFFCSLYFPISLYLNPCGWDWVEHSGIQLSLNIPTWVSPALRLGGILLGDFELGSWELSRLFIIIRAPCILPFLKKMRL